MKLKELIQENKKVDDIFGRLCRILNDCHLKEENEYQVCTRLIEDFKWEFFNYPSLNHVRDLFKLTAYELFDGEWKEIDTEPFYDYYKKLIRNDLNDKDFITAYCYTISGIANSWQNFYEVESNNENVVKIFNANVDNFNVVLLELRKMVKMHLLTCSGFKIVVNEPFFKRIQEGFQFKQISSNFKKD